MTAIVTAVQAALPVFAVKESTVATGDELVMDRPRHAGAAFNTGVVYLEPASAEYHTAWDRVRPVDGHRTGPFHVVRFLDGPAEGLVGVVAERLLVERVTEEGEVVPL